MPTKKKQSKPKAIMYRPSEDEEAIIEKIKSEEPLVSNRTDALRLIFYHGITHIKATEKYSI